MTVQQRVAALARRIRLRVHGRLSESRFVRDLAGLVLLARYLTPARSRVKRLHRLATAVRRIQSPVLRNRLRGLIQPWLTPARSETWRLNRIGWSGYEGDGGVEAHPLTTSLLLKEPGPNGEKGVLYCSFEYNWLRLIAQGDACRFFRHYLLVGASSWSPPDYAVFANLCGLSTDPVFIGISNRADVQGYAPFEPGIRPVPLMACDWVNPSYYSPRPRAERDIDILMVANWMLFKRHWLLFEALGRMRRDLRIVLVGLNGPNRTARDVLDDAKAFGVRQEIECLTRVSIDVVTDLQCRAKVATVLSRREGSCVATTEAFFADTPVAMMDDAHVGSAAHISSETGILMSRSRMARQLSELLDRREQYHPRRWAIDNIASDRSSIHLNRILRTYCAEAGIPWTRDIAPLCWRYVPTYMNPADEVALRGGVERLREDFGIRLQPFLPTPAPSVVPAPPPRAAVAAAR